MAAGFTQITARTAGHSATVGVETWSGRALYLHDTNRLWSTEIDNGTAEINVRFTTLTREDWSAAFQLIEQDELWRISDYHFLDGPLEVDVVP